MIDQDIARCIDDCVACWRSCNTAINGHCLETGGDHLRPEHVRVMVDCAEICRTCADFLMRQSPHGELICEPCARICARCAEECARLDDPHMRDCAEVCRRCAASCRDMVGSLAP